MYLCIRMQLAYLININETPNLLCKIGKALRCLQRLFRLPHTQDKCKYLCRSSALRMGRKCWRDRPFKYRCIEINLLYGMERTRVCGKFESLEQDLSNEQFYQRNV